MWAMWSEEWDGIDWESATVHKERLGTMVRILRQYIVVCLRVGLGRVAVGRFLACATDVEKATA